MKGSILRILALCLAIVLIAGIFIRIKYPFIIMRPVERWQYDRLAEKIGRLKTLGPSAADDNQGTLVAAIIPPKRDYGISRAWGQGQTASLALQIMGRLERPKESTLQAMLNRIDFSAKPNSHKSYGWNYGVLTALGRMGPPAKSLLPDLERLPKRQLGVAEAINRISGVIPELAQFSPSGKVHAEKIKVPNLKTRDGVMSKIEEERVVLVRSDSEWQELWAQHAGTTPRPKIDFSSQSILAYFHGASHSAMGPVLSSISDSNKTLAVTFTVGYSDAWNGFAAFPFIFVEMPRTSSVIIIRKAWWVAMGREGTQEKELARFQPE